jgi:hypothetical protein
MEKALERVAEQVLSFDEASLSNLHEKYRLKIEHVDGTKDWEKSVIIVSSRRQLEKNPLQREPAEERERE